MRKFFDAHVADSASNVELYRKVSGDTFPTTPGFYITNFGNLEFDGTTFRMNGERRFPTVVEWWMKPF